MAAPVHGFMKFGCHCGHTILDITDYLRYKAQFIADQDFEDVDEAISEGMKLLAKEFLKAPSNADQIVSEVGDKVHDTFTKYSRRTMYQCSQCGRLYLVGSDNKWHCFVPNDETVPKNLLRSADGYAWKAILRGSWSKLEHGKVYCEGNGSESDSEWYNDVESVRKQYFKVLNELLAKNMLRDAFLMVDEEVEHRWPERED